MARVQIVASDNEVYQSIGATLLHIMDRCQPLFHHQVVAGYERPEVMPFSASLSYLYLAVLEPIRLFGIFPWRRRRKVMEINDRFVDPVMGKHVGCRVYDPKVLHIVTEEANKLADNWGLEKVVIEPRFDK